MQDLPGISYVALFVGVCVLYGVTLFAVGKGDRKKVFYRSLGAAVVAMIIVVVIYYAAIANDSGGT